MTSFFAHIEDTDDIRQGDIIRKINTRTGAAEKLGIVITADCDIAQKKAGERYTWLEVLPMKAYIEGPWAQEQLRKLSEKRSKGICDQLNGQLRQQYPHLKALTNESLAQWLRNRSAKEILTKITGEPTREDSKQFRDLQGFALTTIDESHTAFSRLKEAWMLNCIEN